MMACEHATKVGSTCSSSLPVQLLSSGVQPKSNAPVLGLAVAADDRRTMAHGVTRTRPLNGAVMQLGWPIVSGVLMFVTFLDNGPHLAKKLDPSGSEKEQIRADTRCGGRKADQPTILRLFSVRYRSIMFTDTQVPLLRRLIA